MIDLLDVAIFVEAAQLGSLAAAARRLGAAPMMASRRLAALEAELGVRLVHRTTRALSLTAEGEAFLPFARSMLEAEAAAREALRHSDVATGLLRLTTSVPFGRKVVARCIPQFMRANPDVRVELLMTDNVVDIVEHGLDLAIRLAPLSDSSLIARRLADNPRGLYASPRYLSGHRTPRVIADLADHECLAMTGVTHWTFQKAGRVQRQRISGRFTASSVEAMHQACLADLGITVLSLWDARDEVANGELVPIVLEDGEPEHLPIWAVYPTARMVTQKVRRFITALEQHLQGV